jgi:heat shock protein HslJ
MTVGPALACTRAFCASAPFDAAFLRILSGESTASIEGDILALHTDRGILRFRR